MLRKSFLLCVCVCVCVCVCAGIFISAADQTVITQEWDHVGVYV